MHAGIKLGSHVTGKKNVDRGAGRAEGGKLKGIPTHKLDNDFVLQRDEEAGPVQQEHLATEGCGHTLPQSRRGIRRGSVGVGVAKQMQHPWLIRRQEPLATMQSRTTFCVVTGDNPQLAHYVSWQRPHRSKQYFVSRIGQSLSTRNVVDDRGSSQESSQSAGRPSAWTPD